MSERAPGATTNPPASPQAGAPGAMLVVISGPSGVGKDTIIDALRRSPGGPLYHYVVTCTTRRRRQGEVDGVDYRFLTDTEFGRLRDTGALLEWAEVHGHWYGTPRDAVRAALAAGQDVILKIDVQGAATVKAGLPAALLIFLVPPSLEALFQRLRIRATEPAEELELRQRNAAIELAQQDHYDYVVVNEDGQVEATARRIQAIIAAERALNAGRRITV